MEYFTSLFNIHPLGKYVGGFVLFAIVMALIFVLLSWVVKWLEKRDEERRRLLIEADRVRKETVKHWEDPIYTARIPPHRPSRTNKLPAKPVASTGKTINRRRFVSTPAPASSDDDGFLTGLVLGSMVGQQNDQVRTEDGVCKAPPFISGGGGDFGGGGAGGDWSSSPSPSPAPDSGGGDSYSSSGGGDSSSSYSD